LIFYDAVLIDQLLTYFDRQPRASYTICREKVANRRCVTLSAFMTLVLDMA
jgi:hypothetical protein